RCRLTRRRIAAATGPQRRPRPWRVGGRIELERGHPLAAASGTQRCLGAEPVDLVVRRRGGHPARAGAVAGADGAGGPLVRGHGGQRSRRRYAGDRPGLRGRARTGRERGFRRARQALPDHAGARRRRHPRRFRDLARGGLPGLLRRWATCHQGEGVVRGAAADRGGPVQWAYVGRGMARQALVVRRLGRGQHDLARPAALPRRADGRNGRGTRQRAPVATVAPAGDRAADPRRGGSPGRRALTRRAARWPALRWWLTVQRNRAALRTGWKEPFPHKPRTFATPTRALWSVPGKT